VSLARRPPAADLVDLRVKQGRVRLLTTIVLLGTVAAIVYHYAALHYLGWGYPRSTFLFRPGDRFNDWDNVYLFAKAFLHGVPGGFAYYPFAILMALASTVLPMRADWVLLIALFLVVLIAILRGWVVDTEKHLLTKVQYGFVLVALSYPVLFVLDRSNLEMLVFVFIAGFFYFLYVRDSVWLAALFLAAAIAFKLYPATLLVLLLAERRFRAFVLTIAFVVGLTAMGTGAMAGLGHFSLSALWQMNSQGKSIYQRTMVLGGGGVQHGHSLWGLVELRSFLMGAEIGHLRTTLYSVAVVLIFGLIAYHVIFRETERWKRVLLVMAAATLLPFVAADYTLIQLYFPLVFFLNARRVSRWDAAYVALFAVLLVPVDYHYFTLYGDGISISVIVYPLALIALMALAVLDLKRVPAETPATAVVSAPATLPEVDEAL
jgi:Glycosyltransferase family 87